MLKPWSDLPLLLCSCAALFPFLLLCASATGQTKPDREVEALLAKIDAARGGPAKPPATLALEGSYVVTFEGAGAEPVARGKWKELLSGTQGARQTSDMGEMGAMERGFLEDYAWELDPMMGAKIYRGSAVLVTRRYFAFLRGASPRELYREFARAGTAQLGGKEHVLLRMTPVSGKPDTWHVDPDTGAVPRIDIVLPTPESADATFGMGDEVESQLLFEDWQAVDGARVAKRRTLKMGPATVVHTCEKIEVGAKLDPASLVPPKAVLALKDKSPASRPTTPDGKHGYEVEERQAQPVASIRLKCKPDQISATLAVVLPEVMEHLTAVGARMTGAPFSRYHAWGGDEIDLEAGFPVANKVAEKGRVKNGELPGGRIVTTWHLGPYEKLEGAHKALQKHLAQSRMKTRGGPWEVYWTDPGMVPDPAKWRTQLLVAIEP